MIGKLNVGVLIAVYVPFIILTPFYSYYMAVKHKQQKPYPAATITQTACHYPQDIAFRFFMLIASSMLALIFFLIFKWVANAANMAGYTKKISSYLFYITQISIAFYGVTIGTIDQKGTGPLHSPCAVIFFVILIIAIVQVTLYLTNLRNFDTRIMGRNSLFAKQLFAVYLVLLWIYCLIMLIAVSEDENFESKGDKYVVIVQWNTVTIGLLWVLTFYWQWDKINLCLHTGYQNSQIDLTSVPPQQYSKRQQMIDYPPSRPMYRGTFHNEQERQYCNS